MSAHDLAKIAREACSRLWTPRVESAGIPLAALQQLVNLLCGWRDVHLSTVAVPNQWPSSWDFVHAVTACAADSNFHVCVPVCRSKSPPDSVADLSPPVLP
jgi:hypothetical protein